MFAVCFIEKTASTQTLRSNTSAAVEGCGVPIDSPMEQRRTLAGSNDQIVSLVCVCGLVM
jgi:hypothetical protein